MRAAGDLAELVAEMLGAALEIVEREAGRTTDRRMTEDEKGSFNSLGRNVNSHYFQIALMLDFAVRGLSGNWQPYRDGSDKISNHWR
jgi:hypothetical protein